MKKRKIAAIAATALYIQHDFDRQERKARKAAPVTAGQLNAEYQAELAALNAKYQAKFDAL